MAFAWQIEHWTTPLDFAAHLARHDPQVAPWAQGVTIHHTYRPLPIQWQGRRSMEALADFYEAKGWDAGPHLFLCVGAPDARNDGIWQGTPLNMVGVHGGLCNAHLWGIEVVGDYDRAPWPAPVADLVYGVSGALFRWRGLAAVTPQSVKGHRECPSTKTCPGASIDMDLFRAQLAQRLEAPIVPQQITEDSTIIAPFRCTQRQAAQYLISRPHPNYTSADITLTIVPAYAELCAKGGVDLCVTIAQMCHEGAMLSFWGARPQRNPAGIGVTGRSREDAPVPPDGWAYNPQRNRWEIGVSFPNWANAAVPAHVGRLLAYALPPDTGTADQQALIAEALRWRTMPGVCRGTAPTLKPLGKAHNPCGPQGCGWASPGDDYGARIAALANAIARQP